jgi:hypothetical protein
MNGSKFHRKEIDMPTNKTDETIYKFKTQAAAERKIMQLAVPTKWTIWEGDDGKFWVLTLAHAAYLLTHGYEMTR